MIDETIEDIIKKHLVFKSVSSSGYHRVYCEVCGDGEGRKKGPRGGWRFQDSYVDYTCFNCGIKGNFDPTREIAYSKNMWKIFEAFNIPASEHKALIAKAVLKNSKKNSKEYKRNIDIQEIEIPDHFYELTSQSNEMTKKAIEFLAARRIKHTSYKFYLSTGVSKMGVKEEINAKMCFNRLIIPAFKNDKMIYYQARILDENSKVKNKYINPDLSKENIIFGYDKLFQDLNKPLFITEGFFDSHHLNGIAVLGNELSKNKIEIINKSPRIKIVVPDKKLDKKENDDGSKLATQAIELGWKVAFPDFGECTDVTKAIEKYGKIYVFDSIIENIKEGFAAKVALQFY